MVKFKNDRSDLTRIDIVLTDFGMADSDSKGGTPVFASPECFEKKEKKSDIFSFGRVILFLLLTKNQFAKWLFAPIKDQNRLLSLRNLTFASPDQPLNLFSKMTSLTYRITLKSARSIFYQLRNKSLVKLHCNLVGAIETIIDQEISDSIKIYTSELCDFRYKVYKKSVIG